MNSPLDKPSQRTEPDSPEWAVQVVLAAMMRSPDRPLMVLIQEHFPERETQFYGNVIRAARELIGGLTDGLHKGTETDPNPTLLDRLSFTWRFLRQADVLVRKMKKSEIAQRTSTSHAVSAFRNILPVPLQEPLLTALLEWLRLGKDGRYLFHYWSFRRASTPTKLPDPFSHLLARRDSDLLRTVVWWSLRARREEYIEVRQNEPVRIEFAFVVEEVLKS